MSHKIFYYKLLCLSLAFIAIHGFALMPSKTAQAQTSPCDPQYMDALQARAWMEAQREIAQNQNLIFKPDSVLAMTCFDRLIHQPAIGARYTQPNRPFSETTRWGSVSGFGDESTDNAITGVVYAALRSYLTANFTNGFADTRVNVTYTLPASPSSNAAYSCNNMGQVWHQARCMEFMDEHQTDGFFDFAWYQSRDPRRLPTEFQCPIAGGATNRSIDGLLAGDGFTQARRTAFNNNQDMFTVDNAAITDADSYLEDPVVSHLDNILPGVNCTGSAVVLTGITVQRSDINGGAPYNEFICVRPGCSANPGGSPACIP